MSSELFAGLPDDELRQLLRSVELQAGDVLCRQGEEADGLYVITTGSVGVYSRLPGGGELELAALGAGEVIGELALVDGGTRAATVRALGPTTAQFLGRADFLALASRLDPTAFALKRRLTAIVCARLRSRFEVLSGALDDHDVPERPPAELAPGIVPDERYLARLQFFRALAPSQLADCRAVEVLAYRTLLRAGARPDTAYVTLNGAVEEVLGTGTRRIRVRLAGPGFAVGYLGLLDGGPSPVTVATRERALLLAVPASAFTELCAGTTPLSYAFVEAVQRDLIAALRQAERPQARLAAAQQARRGGNSVGTSASVTSRKERANSRKR